MRQQIRCHNRNPLWCHAIELTTCSLLRSCGDHRRRFRGCVVWTGLGSESAVVTRAVGGCWCGGAAVRCCVLITAQDRTRCCPLLPIICFSTCGTLTQLWSPSSSWCTYWSDHSSVPHNFAHSPHPPASATRAHRRYIGVIVPLFSRQAEQLIVRGRSKLHLLSRLYDARHSSRGGGNAGDTDTDASADSSTE
jgi:hypothetical protein